MFQNILCILKHPNLLKNSECLTGNFWSKFCFWLQILDNNFWWRSCQSNDWKKCQKFNHGQRKLALMIYDSSNFLTFWRQINGNMMIQKFMKSSQYKICRIHLIFFDFSESLTKTITGNRLIRNQRKQFPWKQNMYYLFN